MESQGIHSNGVKLAIHLSYKENKLEIREMNRYPPPQPPPPSPPFNISSHRNVDAGAKKCRSSVIMKEMKVSVDVNSCIRNLDRGLVKGAKVKSLRIGVALPHL